MTQQSGNKPDVATQLSKHHDSATIKAITSEPAKIRWQAKLAAVMLLGWTLFLAWIAFA